MSNYIISPEAIKDLEEIIDYLASYNLDTGERLLSEFAKKCRYLSQFPMLGRSYREIRPYLRGILMEKYIIFYRIIDPGIEIMRIVKGDRDLESVFPEESE
jgi:toxin ParE1/3/4